MSAIPCASVSLKTMADGTLRISFDIEPMHAQDAFRLFAAPGTPAAIAALQVGYAAVPDNANAVKLQAPASDEEEKLGPLAYWLVLRCNEPEFWGWLKNRGYDCNDAKAAGTIVKNMLGLQSRKDLDGNPDCVEIFHSYVRGPYSKFLTARGIVK